MTPPTDSESALAVMQFRADIPQLSERKLEQRQTGIVSAVVATSSLTMSSVSKVTPLSCAADDRFAQLVGAHRTQQVQAAVISSPMPGSTVATCDTKSARTVPNNRSSPALLQCPERFSHELGLSMRVGDRHQLFPSDRQRDEARHRLNHVPQDTRERLRIGPGAAMSGLFFGVRWPARWLHTRFAAAACRAPASRFDRSGFDQAGL